MLILTAPKKIKMAAIVCTVFFIVARGSVVLAATSTTVAEIDSDGDGLPDRLELLFGTDPHNPDTDGDGFTDGEEVMNGYSPTSTEITARLTKTLHISLTTDELEERVANIPIKTFLISPGTASHPTPVGTFAVLNKNPKAWSSAAGLWMPWWMNFGGGLVRRGLYGVHELPIWPNGYREGADHLGHPASHGCVRLGIGSAKQVYDWTPIGTPVIIERDVVVKN